RIEPFRRSLVAAAGPRRAQLPRQRLPRRVARPGKCKNLPTLCDRHLRQKVACGTEAVDAEPARLARHAVGPVADEPGAQQWCRRNVAVTVGQRKAIPCVGEHIVRVAAIDLVAGEARLGTEILATAGAERAVSAGRAQPWDPDALAHNMSRDSAPAGDDLADDLV